MKREMKKELPDIYISSVLIYFFFCLKVSYCYCKSTNLSNGLGFILASRDYIIYSNVISVKLNCENEFIFSNRQLVRFKVKQNIYFEQM